MRHRFHRPLPGLVVALAALLPAAGEAACDLAAFGASATRTCPRSSAECMPPYLPEEVAGITRGAVVEAIGLAVNDGRASWRALDLDRREVIVVERYAGRRLAQAPAVAASTPNEYLRAQGQDASRWVDHVRRYPLAEARFRALACTAAGAWSERPAPFRELTDTGGRLYLLLADTAQVDLARGRFIGVAGSFVRGVDEVVRRQRPGVTR